uniref:Uncharacterized protein n=1 Tax=Biomphalaria glabrata TaxID=6526 RepID=A0A2C9LTD3_BIOGL
MDTDVVWFEDEEFIPLAIRQYSRELKESTDKHKKEVEQIEFLDAESDICCLTDMNISATPLNAISCEKGNDHSKVKDLQSFSLDDLPRSYRSNDILDLIKSVADLTVMVHLPWTNKTGFFWQGTGKVDQVFIFKENTQCKCQKCKLSDSPSKTWGKVMIATSTNLLKACTFVTEIKCTFFLDNGETKDKVKHLFGDAYVSNYRGVCKFFCYSCDMDLLEKLNAYLEVFSEKWMDAFEHFYKTVKSEEERFLVMVSHPHASIKHIFLGNGAN